MIIVFLPTYREVGPVERVLRRVVQNVPRARILVVDDASPDGTGALLDRLATEVDTLEVIHRPVRMGVGSAHKLALLYARNRGASALVTLDADGSHPPEAIADLLGALDRAECAVAVEPGSSETGGSTFRAYSKRLIDRVDVDTLGSDGDSFGIESSMVLESAAPVERVAVAGMAPPKRSTTTVLHRARAHWKRAASSGRTAHMTTGGVACRVCGGEEHVELVAPRDADADDTLHDVSPYSCASHSGRTHGQILRCLRCGIAFMRPKLEPAELVTEYSKVVDPVYLVNLPARLATFRRTLSTIRPFLGDAKRVLEVGSYCGAFLKVAREAGLDITGLEPSAWAVEQARRITDATIIQGTLRDLPDDTPQFDAVVAWDVVEHFADPVAEMKRVNRALPLGGRFFFCTVMIDNWFPRLVGRYWPWYMDMHLFYFTEATIRHVVERAGFTMVQSTSYRHVTTVEYLLRKLGTLGLPGATAASHLASVTPWGKSQIPVVLGDIQLFSCTKIADVEPAAAVEKPGAHNGAKHNGRLAAIEPT